MNEERRLRRRTSLSRMEWIRDAAAFDAVEARAREEAVPPPTLELPFPFTRVEFDPFFFEGLTLETKQSTAVDLAKTEVARPGTPYR